jgi:hypothetical protein
METGSSVERSARIFGKEERRAVTSTLRLPELKRDFSGSEEDASSEEDLCEDAVPDSHGGVGSESDLDSTPPTTRGSSTSDDGSESDSETPRLCAMSGCRSCRCSRGLWRYARVVNAADGTHVANPERPDSLIHRRLLRICSPTTTSSDRESSPSASEGLVLEDVIVSVDV